MFRAGSPFSGKFVLFKPVLFVQVMPAGSKDAGNGRTAGRFRLTSRLEEEITGSMPGAGTSRGSHHSTKSRGMLSIASPSDFPASPSLRSSKHFSRCRLSDCLITRGLRMRSPALRSTLELRADLIMDSRESTVNEITRASSGISGAKWIGYLRTRGGSLAR